MNLQQLYACYPKIDRIVSLGNEIRESNPEIARLCDFVTEFVADVITVTSGQHSAPVAAPVPVVVVPDPEPAPAPAPTGFSWMVPPFPVAPVPPPAPVAPAPQAPPPVGGVSGLWGNPGYTPGQ
jgi:hypothetical protein